MMNAKERMLAAINRRMPDRLPVTTHHVMKYFLDKYLKGASVQEFFDIFSLDPILWTSELKPDAKKGEYWGKVLCANNNFGQDLMLVMSDNFRVESQEISDPQYRTIRYTFHTPKGKLFMTVQSNGITPWITEHLLKEKRDFDIIANYFPSTLCDVDQINEKVQAYGNRGLVRGCFHGVEVYGQPGCWQDAACLFGIENLIMETYDDPQWVHYVLQTLQKRKLEYAHSLKGANYDILELGGGHASTTVISPEIFLDFVAPYDSEIIAASHEAGQKIVYHTCGGMMPILEDIAAMGPDAMETFTPIGMGGDTNLKEAKRRIGNKVCLIGGFDQGSFFKGCSQEKTRSAVRKCFEEAGENGGFILSPSDHFFDADLELIHAFVDEAVRCAY